MVRSQTITGLIYHDDYNFRGMNLLVINILILYFKHGLLARWLEQPQPIQLNGQPHVVGKLNARQQTGHRLVDLDIEEIAAEEEVGADLVDYYLVAQVGFVYKQVGLDSLPQVCKAGQIVAFVISLHGGDLLM